MKLFYAPGFSSIADHIAMLEAGLQFDLVKVDIETKQVEGDGSDKDINPKGYVPALMFDDGELLTENSAILAWVADRAPSLAPRRARPVPADRDAELSSQRDSQALPHLFLGVPGIKSGPPRRDCSALRASGRQVGAHGLLFGDSFSVADPYLFMVARGARELDFPLAECFRSYVARIETRPSVEEAERREGLSEASSPQA
jgi:glutathione S-transferase